jgi:hypothetical protein
VSVVEATENALRLRDYATYHRHLKIEDRASHNVIPLRLNRIQRRIYNRIVAAQDEGRPCRLVILKARREGVSTLVQSVFACEAFTRMNVKALTVSHEEDSARKLHAMTERMYENLPSRMQPEKVSGIRGKRMELTHGSALEVATAGGDGEVGRSGGYTKLHLSELAQYPNAETTWQGVVPTIPEEPGTIIAAESTPKGRVGRGAFFFNLCRLAMDPDSIWEFLFFAWFDFPDYARPVPHDFVLTEEEQALKDRHELSDEQIAWRRHTIDTYFKQDPERFAEEYPATPEEAFLHSGRPFFQPLLVQRMAAVASKRVPVFRGELGSVGEYPSPGQPAKPYPSTTGRLRILKPPEDGHRYVLALDPAGVITSREFEAFTDKTNARDYCAMLVVDRYTRKAVAYWHSRMDLGLVGYEAAKLGKLYHRAMIAVEMTGGYGAAPLDRLRELGYSPLYTRVQLDSLGQKIGEDLGWSTTVNNRSRILEGLRDLLRDDPAALAIPELAVEMDAFVEGDSGKAAAAPGEHDDLVMAAAIAFEVCREFPQTILLEEAA